MTTQLQPTMNQSIGFSPLAGSRGPLEALVARAVGHFNVLQAWNERARQRRALSRLDDRLLVSFANGSGHRFAALACRTTSDLILKPKIGIRRGTVGAAGRLPLIILFTLLRKVLVVTQKAIYPQPCGCGFLLTG